MITPYQLEHLNALLIYHWKNKHWQAVKTDLLTILPHLIDLLTYAEANSHPGPPVPVDNPPGG